MTRLMRLAVVFCLLWQQLACNMRVKEITGKHRNPVSVEKQKEFQASVKPKSSPLWFVSVEHAKPLQ
jgi:hypothetical protein